ncbi:hypothetical protein BKA83DRAFT_4165553 [Pisolithus microcarpus]|nr:hypothetical protein BKA83DRAFT_4165553 [Pisolithus microcarpus]
MDRFLAPNTSEAMAHSQLTENWFTWDQDHPSFNETLVAGCASYQAFNRYLSDFGPPYSSTTLYQSPVKHFNPVDIVEYVVLTAQLRNRSGMSLSKDDNTEVLLALHAPKLASQPASERTISSAGIRT